MRLQAELVRQESLRPVSGIGRYVRELYSHLSDLIPVRLASPVLLPLASHMSVLEHFPLHVRGHQRGSVVHFTYITGCSQMLWNPIRPAVATVHDLGVLVCKEDEQLFSDLDRHILAVQFAGLRRMDQYAVNSDFTRQGLMELFGTPEERIHLVQLGVDNEHFRPIADAAERLQARYGIVFVDDLFDLLYVGSELPRKNVGLLLKAVAVLKERGYKLRLIKVGGSGGTTWRAKLLAEVSRLELEEDIELVDVVPEEDLPLFYNVADICITPTLLEGGFAWLAMEGMACGKPIVASSSAHIPPDAEEAVLVVPPRDLDALVEAIASCLDDEGLRRQMGNAGRRIITQEKYTWRETARAMVRVYEASAGVL